jgi:uncharacterized Zn finger protein (UPF0148 family)
MTAVPIEHTGRYSCPVCVRRFDTLPQKKQHIQTKHPRPKGKR